MYSFSNPAALLLLACLPAYFLLRRMRVIRPFFFSLTLGDWNAPPFSWKSPLRSFIDRLSFASIAAAFFFAVLALAGPVRFKQEAVYSGPRNAAIFVVDVSPSMAARDLSDDSRLDVARRRIHECVLERPGFSFGLAALGSEAALLIPPTSDHVSFRRRLDGLRIGEMGDGTALGLGLAVAAAHLQSYRAGAASVILFTDGENNTGEINPRTSASLFVSESISFFVVGIGTNGQVPLEYDDPASGKHYSGFLDSRFDESALKDIAARGNGKYFSVSDTAALDAAFASIGSALAPSKASWSRTLEEPLDRYCAVLALASAALAWIFRRLILGAFA